MVLSNLVKISEIPEIVERLTQRTQYRHSKDNFENKTFGEILNEELKNFEEEGINMIAIKEIAKEMTLDEFNKRFTKEAQGVKDTLTGNIHFCPNDLGFRLTRSNCEKGLICKKCWGYIEGKLKENQILKEKLNHK